VLQHAEILHALQARDPKMAHAAAVLHIGASQAWFRQNVYPERRISLPAAPEPRLGSRSRASVTLPSRADQGELHVFAFGTDQGPLTTGD
jgi:hypothetical protein